MEFGHGFNGLFNGSLLVDSVARVRRARSGLPMVTEPQERLPVVKVDIIRPQLLQRFLARLPAVFRGGIDLPPRNLPS